MLRRRSNLRIVMCVKVLLLCLLVVLSAVQLETYTGVVYGAILRALLLVPEY